MIELSWIVVLKFWLYDANLCRSQNYLGTIWRPGVYFSLNIDGVILGPMVGWDFQESNSDFKYFLIVEIGNHLFSTCLTSLTFDLYMLRIGASEKPIFSCIIYVSTLWRNALLHGDFTVLTCCHHSGKNAILYCLLTSLLLILTIHLIILTVLEISLISGCCWVLQFIFGVLQFYCD